MAQAYVPQAMWNNGNAGGSLCNELKELERVKVCRLVSEAESLDSFIPLQLDTFPALWNLYDPSSERSRPSIRDERERKPRVEKVRDRHESHQIKAVEGGKGRAGRPRQVYDFTRRTGASASPTTNGKS